ncbi:hypothetical protein DFS34DRAFT_590601 [Phlyctochytrium arcticum]|nr:hypothetical protein DFS34DRAFT_590601 [Phlyctochytrium arcticum]
MDDWTGKRPDLFLCRATPLPESSANSGPNPRQSARKISLARGFNRQHPLAPIYLQRLLSFMKTHLHDVSLEPPKVEDMYAIFQLLNKGDAYKPTSPEMVAIKNRYFETIPIYSALADFHQPGPIPQNFCRQCPNRGKIPTGHPSTSFLVMAAPPRLFPIGKLQPSFDLRLETGNKKGDRAETEVWTEVPNSATDLSSNNSGNNPNPSGNDDTIDFEVPLSTNRAAAILQTFTSEPGKFARTGQLLRLYQTTIRLQPRFEKQMFNAWRPTDCLSVLPIN